MGLFALAALGLGTRDSLLRISYTVGAVFDLALLGGVLRGWVSVQRALDLLLILGLALGVGVMVDAWTADLMSDVEVSFLLFRASVLISGVAFLAAGARTGAVVALGYVLGVVVLLVALEVPAVGDDRAPGVFEIACLLVGVVAILRALNVRMRTLEATAQRATADAALAYRDELTGLPNRRRMTQHLRAAVGQRTGHDGRGDALILFDLDHFKAINDHLGHNVGDDVLKRTAALASAALREVDRVGRWGGEEFLAVLTGVTSQTAVAVAERTRHAMADVGGPTGVTGSFGVTMIQADEVPDAALRRADEALYAAKRAGRNQVWMADPDQGLSQVSPTATSGAMPLLAPAEPTPVQHATNAGENDVASGAEDAPWQPR